MKKQQNFQDFVSNFSDFGNLRALTIQRFIKIEGLSYKELKQKVYQAANFLTEKGLKTDDKIMIVAPNSPEWVTVFLGAAVIGVTVVSVDSSSSRETIAKFASLTNPKLIFSTQALKKNLPDDIDFIDLEHVFYDFCEVASTAPSLQLTGEEALVIVFTSGTTADPKGVVLTHRNILSNLEGIEQVFDVDKTWQYLSVLPLSHMYELTIGCLLPLCHGGGVHYLPKVTPLAISRAMKQYHISVIASVPQLGSLMMQKIERTAENKGITKKLEFALKIAPAIPHRLRKYLFKPVHKELGGKFNILAFGGAPMEEEVARKWELMGVKAVQGYGLTETSPLVAGNVIAKRRLSSQGMIMKNLEWKLSESGELLVKGPSVFKEYYNNPEATRAAFTDGGYFKTGDIGEVDKTGWLRLYGRAKFAIVLSSGLKVFPDDVELVARKNPVLKNICVVGVKTDQGEVVEAVIVSDKSDQEIDLAISEVNTKLESFQHIDRWVRWIDSDFPRTRLLKVERKIVQAWANNREIQLEKKDGRAPVHTTDPLLQIVGQVLEKSPGQVNEEDKLADIGLDSLRRLALVSIIEEQLGIAINEASITKETTLRNLRKIIETAPAAAEEAHRPRWPFNPIVRFFGNCFRETFARFFAWIFVGYKVIGRENLTNLKTPILVAFNHVDYFDSFVFFKALPRFIRKRLSVAAASDMMEDYKKISWIGRFTFASFNLERRGQILPSLKYLAELVDRGWSIAISPEGRITTDGNLQEFKSGIGLLAVELGIPVICVTTKGLYGTLSMQSPIPKRHGNVQVKISAPLTFGRNTSYEEATKKIRETMLEQIERS